MIGVLGGMGPAATVDFMSKVIRLVPATRDQEHVPLLVVSDPRIPDRVGPILDGRGPSPLDAMIRGVRALEAGGAQAIAVPCHTAHAWSDGLIAATRLPLLHLVRATLDEVARVAPVGPIGLLATRATLAAGLYQPPLEASGRPPLVPDQGTMETLILPAILQVKQNRADAAAGPLREAIDRLAADGAQAVVLACTELPVAFDVMTDEAPVPVVDATLALARAAVDWWSDNGC